VLIKQEGFSYSFNPAKCEECGGKCCTGESGYIWINSIEMQRLATHLKISVDELKQNYLIKEGYRYSIKEKKIEENNYACLFFDTITKKCTIYEYRPTQCRTFPFWDYFKNNIKEVKEECIGILD